VAENNGSSGLRIMIWSGLFAILGTVAGGVVKGYWDDRLAQHKFYSDLVLKALELNSAQDRLDTLKLLVETNLIPESAIQTGVNEYISKHEKNPSAIPQVRSFPAIVVKNARIYLLTGSKDTVQNLEPLQRELVAGGFNVIGAKSIDDSSLAGHTSRR